MTERIIDRAERNLDALPQPRVENLKKASLDQLADEVVTLRMFIGSLVMDRKDVAKDYVVLHGRLSDIEARLNRLEDRTLLIEGNR